MAETLEERLALETPLSPTQAGEWARRYGERFIRFWDAGVPWWLVPDAIVVADAYEEEPMPERPNFTEAVTRGIRAGLSNAFRRPPRRLRLDLTPDTPLNRAERRRREREERIVAKGGRHPPRPPGRATSQADPPSPPPGSGRG